MSAGQKAPEGIVPLWDLGEIPFHVGFRPEPSNAPFADLLPFRLGVHESSGRVAQVPDPELPHQLELAYRRGSQIGTPMSDHGFGLRVRDEFVDYVTASLGERVWAGLRVLEIGCGKGYLANRLSELGAEVTGMDPGAPDSRHPGGPRMIQEEFSPDLLDHEFDVIIHFGVLEHVLDPGGFIEAQLEVLAPDGLIMFAVPDCEAPLTAGDISILVHQHWSYFDPQSLERIAAELSLEVDTPVRGRHAGGLYCCWHRSPAAGEVSPANGVAQTFVSRAQQGVDRVNRFCGDLSARGATLGLFPGSRFMNFAALADELPALRLFDDDPRLHGQYYPPIQQPVESREQLLDDPPEALVITSRTFLDDIRTGLAGAPELDGCAIHALDEILHGEAKS